MKYGIAFYLFITIFCNALQASHPYEPSAPPAVTTNILMVAEVFNSYNTVQQATIMQDNKKVGTILPIQQPLLGEVIGFGNGRFSRPKLPDEPTGVYFHNREAGSFHFIGQIVEGQVSELKNGQLRSIRRENYIESLHKCCVSLYQKTEAMVRNDSARAFSCFTGSTLSVCNLMYLLVGSHNPLVATVWLSMWCFSAMVGKNLKENKEEYLTLTGSLIGATVGFISALGNRRI